MSTLDDKLEEETVVTGTVLVVDDERGVYEPGQLLLEMQRHSTRNGTDFNWRVYTASNPFQALDIARRFRPGVAIVDLNYPGFDEDGYWLLSELKKIDKTIAVGVLTGDNRPETIKEAVRRADNYWVKPVVFDSPKFLADLRELEDLSSEDRVNLIHAFRSRLNLGLEPSFSVEEEPSFPVSDNIGRLIEAVYHLPSNTADLRTGAKQGVAQVERVDLRRVYQIGRVATVTKLYEPPEFERQHANYEASMRTRYWHPSTPHFWEKKHVDEKGQKESVFAVHRVVPGAPYSHIFEKFNEIKATTSDSSVLSLIERAKDAMIETALNAAVEKHKDDRLVRPDYDDQVKRTLSPQDILSVQSRYARDLRTGMLNLKKVAGLNLLSPEREKEYNLDLTTFMDTFDDFKFIAPFGNSAYDSALLPTLIDLSTGNIGIRLFPAVMRPSADVLVTLISNLEKEGALNAELRRRFGFFEGSNKIGKGYEGSSMAEDWAHFLNDPGMNLTTAERLLNAKKIITMYRDELNVAPLDDILGLRIYLGMASYRGPRKARNILDEYMMNNWEDYLRNVKTWDQAKEMDRKYFSQIRHWIAQAPWAASLGYSLYSMLESARRKPNIDEVIEKLGGIDMEEHSRKLISMGLPQRPQSLREKMIFRHNFMYKWYGPEKLVYAEPSPESIRRAA